MNSPTNLEASSLPSFLSAVLENIADEVVACDANGFMTSFNRSLRKVAGSTAQSVGPDDWAKAYGLTRADGSIPKKEEIPLYRALCGEVLRDLEYEVFRSDGSYRVVLCNGQAIFDEAGEKIGAVVTMQDITKLKAAVKVQEDFNQQLEKMVKLRTRELQQAKGALTDSEKRFRTLFEQSPLSVQLLAVDGRTLAVNAAWKQLWNVSDDFIKSFLLTQYNVLNDPLLEKHGILPLVKKAFGGVSVRVPPHYYDPRESGVTGGEWRGRWLESYLHPIIDEDGLVREVVLIHNDVTDKVEFETELKRAKEEAEQANRLKSSFLANMSHEIRTPLSAMLGYAQILKSRDVNTDESQRFLDIIERNAISLARIIDDILDLSRVEAGRLEVKKVSVSLKILLEDVANLLRMQLNDKSIALEIRPIPTTLKKIKTDPLRLRQILINLIGNALKFTETGKVTVETSEFEGKVKISVADTGIGIPKELHQALFQTFSQADNSYTRQFAGTGLGLALSRRLAEAISGEVQLDWSTPGVGSVFSVTLPFEQGVGGETVISVHSIADVTSKGALSGHKILIVEDFDDNRMLINRMLSKQGALTEEATNGAEAVELALSENFDAIVMDIQMPVLDGLQATINLRSKGYTKPIIALTAHAMIEERNRCLEAGANAHIVKPINFELLITTIKQLVAKN